MHRSAPRPRTDARRLRGLATALTAAVLTCLPVAAAQAVGDDADLFLDAAGAAPSGDAYRVGAMAVEPLRAGDLLSGVALEGDLDEAGIADAAAVLAIATGYGAGIEAPIASFLSGRAAGFAGQGPVTVGVEAFELVLDVEGGEPPSARLELTLPQEPESAFGPPVAVRGPADADVVVREFADFQCPACRQYATQVLPELEAGILAEEDVRFEFHHLPLVSLHANAVPAAEASQCVADLFGDDAFWGYHDLLYERQSAWGSLGDPEPYFGRLVRDLDPARLEGAADPAAAEADLAACIASGASREAVAAARDVAAELGLASTPTVFVGGYRLDGFGDPAGYARLARLVRAGSSEAEAP